MNGIVCTTDKMKECGEQRAQKERGRNVGGQRRGGRGWSMTIYTFSTPSGCVNPKREEGRTRGGRGGRGFLG